MLLKNLFQKLKAKLKQKLGRKNYKKHFNYELIQRQKEELLLKNKMLYPALF